MDWLKVDWIETATVGVPTEAPVATGEENVERMDGHDPSDYEFRSHSIYAHLTTGGVVCVADCWDRATAQRIGFALANSLDVLYDDYTLDMVEGDPEGWVALGKGEET